MRTGVVFQYMPGGTTATSSPRTNTAAVSDWIAFLQSYLATGTPVIP